MNRHFSKEDIYTANKHEKGSSSLLIKEMQIKTTMRYHLMPVRMVIIKKSGNNRHWEAVEKQERFYTVGGGYISSPIVEDSVVIPQGPRNRNSI